jgi:glycine oxidase
MRVTIIGAGVIGLSIAWELSRRGVQVRVVERGELGRESSWAAAGILPAASCVNATDPIERFRGLSHSLYPKWADELIRLTGIDPGLRRCGGIYLASSIGEAASLMASLEYQRDLRIEVQSLTREQLASREPALFPWANSSRFRAAALSPDEWQVRPPDLIAALASACKANGVRLDEHADAEFEIQSGNAAVRITGADGKSEHVQSEQVVVCGGAWTGKIASSLGLGNCVIPIRGQMLMYRFAEPPLRHIINEGHRYLVPREDGRVLVGSCEEETGFIKATTQEMLEPLREWAESVLPAVAQLKPEKEWSALRPGTFDGFPLIGRVPSVSNLAIAAGHYRSGIHLAPATAVAIADQLQQIENDIDLSAFNVGRLMSAT